jgi:hypothetical protein
VELPQAEAGPVKNQTPGPVGLAVEAEVSGLAQAQLRPALVAIAPAMARILDNPRAPSAQPAAAKVLVSVMDTLHKGSAQGVPRQPGAGADYDQEGWCLMANLHDLRSCEAPR